MTSSTLKNNNKPLKWTTQRVNNNIKSTTTTNRVHKRTPVTVSKKNKMTAEIKMNPSKEIEKLLNELEFTYDTVATITVHFESLHHAYICSKPELDKSKSATRLGEMEKELLTAYDDLGLQVTHLERKIAKLEKRLSQLRELEAIYCQATNNTESPLSINNDLILSPCSSIDSNVTDSFYCHDWTLSQVIHHDLLFDNNLHQHQTEQQQQQQQQFCQQQQNFPLMNEPIDTSLDYFQDIYCDLNLYNNTTEELFLSYPVL